MTVTTKYQIGWMAVGVGFLVAFSLRRFGKGITLRFGVIGATLALFGCVLGNLLSTCWFVSQGQSVPLDRVLWVTFTQPAIAWELLQAGFSPMDILFYGIAVYEGYKFSFVKIDRSSITCPSA